MLSRTNPIYTSIQLYASLYIIIHLYRYVITYLLGGQNAVARQLYCMCPHITTCVLILLLVSSYYYLCPHTTTCVLILLCMCPHTTTCVLILLLYVSSYYHLCPHTAMYVSSYSWLGRWTECCRAPTLRRIPLMLSSVQTSPRGAFSRNSQARKSFFFLLMLYLCFTYALLMLYLCKWGRLCKLTGAKKEEERPGSDGVKGTQFTCFTGTKVQILTRELKEEAGLTLCLSPRACSAPCLR
jgi:hypothetical protein